MQELLRGCRAFLFPGLEDFGIAPVEVDELRLAGGRVRGWRRLLDTVVPGVTGELFTEASGENLAAALAAFDLTAYDPHDCRAQAECFSVVLCNGELAAYLAWVAAPQTTLP